MITKSQIPNVLTGARAVAVPIALTVMLLDNDPLILFGIFVFAAITDFFDGYLARKWHCVSTFGALVDPVADKLLVALMLLYLLQHNEMPITPVALILLREIYISSLREFLSARGFALPVSQGGKLKTAAQMVSIATLLFALAEDMDSVWNIGLIGLWISAVLAITSAVQYTKNAAQHFSK